MLTLRVLSTAPENTLPLAANTHVTLPSWRAKICPQVISSMFHTYCIINHQKHIVNTDNKCTYADSFVIRSAEESHVAWCFQHCEGIHDANMSYTSNNNNMAITSITSGGGQFLEAPVAYPTEFQFLAR